MIRIAQPTDAASILSIYAPYIRDTSLTFETEVPTEGEFVDRISRYLNNWPWIVCEDAGKVAGYAYASRYRERTGYQWSVECSIYIDSNFQRKGIARSLYAVLFALLQKQGFTTVYAVINLPNEKSVALHESMGFRWFATYEKVGYKLGQWKNVGWWQIQINEYLNEPPVPIPFSKLDPKIIREVLYNQ